MQQPGTAVPDPGTLSGALGGSGHCLPGAVYQVGTWIPARWPRYFPSFIALIRVLNCQ